MTIRVTSRHGEPPERLLQRFKRICSKEGVLKELKKRRFFEKPSERRRRQAKEAKREAMKLLRRKLRARKGRARR